MIDEAGGSWKVAQPQYSGQSETVSVPVLVLRTMQWDAISAS